jgi:hypothetical protein
MQHEELSTAHRLFHLSLEHWPYTLAVIGAGIGWVIWAAHQIFSTKDEVGICKSELILALERHESEGIARQDKSNTENAIQHNDIRRDINRLTDHLLERNGK